MQYAGIKEASDPPTTSLSRAVAECSSYVTRQRVEMRDNDGNARTNPRQKKRFVIGPTDNATFGTTMSVPIASNADDASAEETVMELEQPVRGKFVIYNGDAIPNHKEQALSFSSNNATVKVTRKVLPSHIVIGHNDSDDELMQEEDGSTQLYPHDDYLSVAFMDVDPSPQPPLIVVDGANVAHTYFDCKRNANSSLCTTASLGRYNKKKEPDPEGIDIVTQYFLSHGCRVIVVVPSFWLRAKPTSQDANPENALMVTPQLEKLQHLQQRGLICCAPPSDDDDAYAIAIARRAERQSPVVAQSQTTNVFYGRAYLVSNDWFRDAIYRDGGVTRLKEWLQNGSSDADTGPGRISYTFCHLGTTSHLEGEPPLTLDFIPNPRHALIQHIERAALSERYTL